MLTVEKQLRMKVLKKCNRTAFKIATVEQLWIMRQAISGDFGY
jgi:hypothetical protein